MRCQAFTRYIFFTEGKYSQHRCPFEGHHRIDGKTYCMRHADKVRLGISFRHGTQKELAEAYKTHPHMFKP